MTLRAGRYELLGTIASGGMATVHLGRAVGAGGFERLVAIKTMHPHLSDEPEFVSMFLDEARLAARIRHPNVIGTIDIQQDEQGLLLVMEYIEGPSLSQVIRAHGKQKKTIPLDVAVRILLDTLAGLHAAHELCGTDGEPLNVIHRDVSPHNILVGVDGIARIMDFGVARAESRISASTRAGDVKGKIVYMAPEQAAQKEMDRRVDVYAAGVTCWEVFAGRRLVRADNDLAAMGMILNATWQPPHEFVPTVPEGISDVVMRAISRNREDRFATTAAFAEALEQAAKAAGIVIATPRAVGTFVRELGIHKSPADLPPSSLPPQSLPSMISGSHTGSSAAAKTMPSALETGIVSSTDGSTTSTGTRGALTSTPPDKPQPTPSNRKLVGAIAASLVVVGLGVWFALSNSAGGDKPAPAVGSESPAIATTTASPTVVAPPADPAPAASSTAAATAPSSTQAAPSPKTTAPAAKKPTAPTTGPKTPKTFVPKEL